MASSWECIFLSLLFFLRCVHLCPCRLASQSASRSVCLLGRISEHIDGSMQERHNSIANALELHLSCINPSIYIHFVCMCEYIWLTCAVNCKGPHFRCVPLVRYQTWPRRWRRSSAVGPAGCQGRLGCAGCIGRGYICPVPEVEME